MKALRFSLPLLPFPPRASGRASRCRNGPAAGPWPAETPVAFGQAVRVGGLVVTPLNVVEDSRCPMNARCVWAGRVIVQTRIEGAGWRETANLALGVIYTTHGQMLALAAVAPEKTTDHQIQPREYRFNLRAARRSSWWAARQFPDGQGDVRHAGDWLHFMLSLKAGNQRCVRF
jgi:hypothetical protein